MNDIGDLELNILSCILIKPDLMKKIRVEDKHFRKYQRTWQFMKACYKKFGTLDLQLMYAVCKNKYHLIEYLAQVLDIEPTYHNFEKYQDMLMEQYKESQKDKWIKERVYVLANDLYVGNVKVNEFKGKVNEIFDAAKQIYDKI